MESLNIRTLGVGIAILFGTIASCRVMAEPWLQETFDTYSTGPLNGQGGWTGSTQRIIVVTTNSLTGRAVYLDARENPMLPFVPQATRPVAAPISSQHLFSFAVRVDTRAAIFDNQAVFALGTDLTQAVKLTISPVTADMVINNDFLDNVPPLASWDLGTVAGGNPDLTTGTYHLFEILLDFGKSDTVFDDYVLDVRLDGQTQAQFFHPGLPGPICLQKPMDRLVLINGYAAFGSLTPSVVFFDSIVGQSGLLAARHWQLY